MAANNPGQVSGRGDDVAAQDHERTTIRSALSEAAWCLRGMLWHVLVPVRRVPACRLGLHEWCDCCSPHFCVRCEKRGPE